MEQKTNNPSIIPFNPVGKTNTRWLESNAARHLSETSQGTGKSIFYSVWDNATDGLRLCDKEGIVIAVNRAFCEMFGKAEHEIVNRHFNDLYGDEVDKKGLQAEYEKLFLSEEVRPRFYRTYQLHSGKRLEAEVMSTYIADEKNQKYMLTQFRDVTKERKAQRLLQENEQRFRNLFTYSPLAMFQITKNGKIINANNAFIKLLGYESFYQILEVDTLHFFSPENQESEMLQQMLAQRGYVVRLEMQMKRKNGRPLSTLVTARAVTDSDGNVVEYEGVLEDITSRKHMERKLQEYVWALEKSKTDLSELNAQKDKLFSILSHDLRSPFSSILGFCDILIKENKQLADEERVQFIGYIQEAAQDQLALVNKLLDWSRLESGRIKMERSNIDLQDVVAKCIHSLLGLARQKKITLVSALPANTIVRGDHQLLQQVFTNLVGNALKFTQQGGLISIEMIEERNNQWTIGVRDTGMGIPEEDLHKLFKIEEKYTRKGIQGEKGTGLGLPVVSEIMQKHHATIRAQSKVGVGTTFVLSFPKGCSSDAPSVLIVDDAHGVRVLHSRYIERVMPKVNILYATDGKEAYQMVLEFHPKLIVSDCDMPELDGHDFVRQVKGNPASKDIPIVIITGHDSDSNRERLKDYGVIDILTKPVSPEQLEEVIKKYAEA